jgi:hypothetical protein
VIIRKAADARGWTPINNDILENGNLSFKARGLLSYLLSRPDGWDTSARGLAASKHSNRDGRDAILTGFQELQAAGYLVRIRQQDPATGQWSSIGEVHSTPVATPENSGLDIWG